MPPKVNKKTEEKKKDKVVEDKTFGLKNKKGAKQQKFIDHVHNQVKNQNQSAAKLAEDKFNLQKKKDDAKKQELELNLLFKPVAGLQKIGKDVDPKSVLCPFFKNGVCDKGNRCKFSHDLEIDRKAAKKNIYVDSRELESDTMDTWDEAKLNEVVEKKHGEKESQKNKTDIICKFFLDAIELNKYGWFWECPNGASCIYRHAVPNGYILKKEKKKLDDAEKADSITLEELIEKERAALPSNLTKVTYESFKSWKKQKIAEKRAKLAASESKKRNEFKAGRQVGLSGRDLFTYNPELILDDDADADDTQYRTERNEDDITDNTKLFDASTCFVEDYDNNDVMASSSSKDGVVPQLNNVVVNEDLFDVDELPDSDVTSDEDDGDDGPGCSSNNHGVTNGHQTIDSINKDDHR